ncbi:MAG: biopolymer transporter ExbD [Candidatus Lernaella stagnicola]|nr:biopolymer transporter ExbD [Candidatus Lernaella stagnicola]
MAFAASKRKRIGISRRPQEPLKLTSLMDLMTVIIVFLLQSFSSTEFQVRASEDLHLPDSVHTKIPIESVQLIISRHAIVVEGRAVARVTDDYEIDGVEPDNLEVTAIYVALKKQAEIEKERAKRYGREFNGNITIQAHEEIPYKLLVKALVTAGKAEFGNIKFMAFKVGE